MIPTLFLWGAVPTIDKGSQVLAYDTNPIEAKVSTPTILLDGSAVKLQAYEIGGNNYVRLRDLAYLMNGTDKSFDVVWDNEKSAINIASQTSYKAIGGELTQYNSETKKAVLSTAPVYNGDKKLDLTAYIVDDTTYFQLRDLGKVLDFSVTWDSQNQGVAIDTTVNVENEFGDVTWTPVIEPVLPKTQAAFEQMFLYMMQTKDYRHTFKYDAEMITAFKNGTLEPMIVNAFSAVFDKYPEHFCYKNHVSLEIKGYLSGGDMTLILNSTYLTDSQAEQMYGQFFSDAKQIIRTLRNENKLTKDMTQEQMARVLYEWVVVNLKYDTNYEGASYTGYGAIKYKTAVCQGYTALYNTLCKLVGIEIWGVSGIVNTDQEHIWSQAILDGQTVYIDTTFGDPLPDQQGACDFKYFMISEQELRKNHTF
jgi:hypothetical protein